MCVITRWTGKRREKMAEKMAALCGIMMMDMCLRFCLRNGENTLISASALNMCCLVVEVQEVEARVIYMSVEKCLRKF